MSYMRVPYQQLRRITEHLVTDRATALEAARQYLATHCARCGAQLETDVERNRVVCEGCYEEEALAERRIGGASA